MPKQETFEYAIIRLVPKVEREEFLNIGVVVFSKRLKFLEAKFKLNRSRLTALNDELDFEEIEKYLKSWVLICKGSADGGPIAQCELPYRFRWLTANRSTIIQTSSVHSGRTSNPERELGRLFIKYVS